MSEGSGGRFGKLELSDPTQEVTMGAKVLRDHVFYLEQAREAYGQGRYERALQMYTRALEQKRDLLEAWVGQVRMLLELGELSEARVWVEKALELFTQHPALLAAKAQVCVRQGDLEAAYASSDAALQREGSSAYRWLARGEVLIAQRRSEGSAKRAEVCFRKALGEPDAAFMEYVLIGQILMRYDQFALAYPYLREATQREPGSSFAWLLQGKCQQALALKKEARRSFSRCLELQGCHDEARVGLQQLGQRGLLERLRDAIRNKD